jgi:hypothetical protein
VPCDALKALVVLALAGLTPSCVIGRASRSSASEVAQGPLAPAVLGAPVVPATLAENSDAAPDKGRPGAVWLQGYWHWDGVSYVWQRGRWQNQPPTR